MSAVLSLAFLSSALIVAPEGADVPKGAWTQSELDPFERVFGVRFEIDLGEFEVLGPRAEEWVAPLIGSDGSRVYIATRTGVLVAHDLETGERIWKRSGLGTIGASMCEHEGVLVVGSNADLVALGSFDGKERWRRSLGARIGGRIVADGDLAIAPLRPNAFVAFDIHKGEESWRSSRPMPETITIRGQAAPAIDRARGNAYLGFSDGTLVAVSLDRGERRWLAQVGKTTEFFADIDAQPIVVDGGRSVLAASYNVGVGAFDTTSGTRKWHAKLEHITGLADTGGLGIVVATSGDGQVLGLDRASGAVRWRYAIGNSAPTEPIFVGRERVVVATSGGPLTVLDAKTGRPVQVLHIGSGTSVTPGWRDPDLALFSNHGRFFALRYGDGSGIQH